LIKPSPAAEAFYSEVLQLMAESHIPFLVSGTYALASYTGIDRPTKDVDVFAKAGDALKMLHYFKEHGFEVEIVDERWLYRITRGEMFVDVITNMPTQATVDNILQNRIDLGLVNLPVVNRHLKITPLCPETLVAIFPVGTRGVPDEVTPDFVARQNLLVEQTSSAAYPLVLGWLSGQPSAPRAPTALGTVEALKSAVASNLGMAIVPEVSVAMHSSDFIVRPLRPSLSRTLALIEHRNKPNEPALEIVREALLDLRAVEAVGPKIQAGTAKRRRNKPRDASA
jgi:hypothetical protein